MICQQKPGFGGGAVSSSGRMIPKSLRNTKATRGETFSGATLVISPEKELVRSNKENEDGWGFVGRVSRKMSAPAKAGLDPA